MKTEAGRGWQSPRQPSILPYALASSAQEGQGAASGGGGPTTQAATRTAASPAPSTMSQYHLTHQIRCPLQCCPACRPGGTLPLVL